MMPHKLYGKLLSTFFLFFFFFSAASTEAAERQFNGQYGEASKEETLVVRNLEEWNSLWKKAGTDSRFDFDPAREIVVAVFLGTRPTGAFSVEIVFAKEEDGAFVIRYKERAPGPGAMVAQVITSPYLIKVFPRTDLEVRIERAP